MRTHLAAPVVDERDAAVPRPLSSECGTHKTVTARFWPWLPGKNVYVLSTCSLFARTNLATPVVDERDAAVPRVRDVYKLVALEQFGPRVRGTLPGF